MKKGNSISILGVLMFSFVLGLSGSITTFAAGPAIINLGTAANFAILAKSGITDVPSSIITGNIGASPIGGTAIAPSCSEVSGTVYDNNAGYTGGFDSDTTCLITNAGLLTTAVNDMQAAYTQASAPATPAGVGASNLNVGAGTLNGQNFVPGTYTWGTNVTIAGDITLTGGAADIWVFQISGTLDLAVNKKILLAGGAQASHIFWQVAGATTLLTGSTFEGNILEAGAVIALQAGAVLHGRALSLFAVTLNQNTVTTPTATAATKKPSALIVTPIIGLLKVPTPLALLSPGSVTYNYSAWNVGKAAALVNVTVVDDKCTPVKYLSGDFNANSKLDSSEIWKYSCTSNLTATTTNTAIATAYSDDVYHSATIATAIATVVVGAPVPAPIINLVKVPSQLTPLSFGGGNITYTYTVTNPGVVAMHDVVVTDDKCSQVSGLMSGDTNNNNLLDVNESWKYTCTTNVSVSTGSVGTVKGVANNITALAYAFTNVLVGTPELPNTGFFSDMLSGTWNAVILLGIFALLLILVLKRRRV